MRHPHHRRSHANPHDHLRRRIIARLIAADRALPDAPELAALHLDGVLSDLLAVCSPGANSLVELEQRAPALAWRLRLALQAPDVAARLAHCWALLDLLTQPTTHDHHTSHFTRRSLSAPTY